MTKSAPLDIDQWLQEQFDSLEYAEHMDDGVDKRRLLMFRWRYDQARDEITRLRRLASERDEMVERCARNPIIHASDCAVHNEPYMPNGPCDCGPRDLVDVLVGALESAVRYMNDVGAFMSDFPEIEALERTYLKPKKG